MSQNKKKWPTIDLSTIQTKTAFQTVITKKCDQNMFPSFGETYLEQLPTNKIPAQHPADSNHAKKNEYAKCIQTHFLKVNCATHKLSFHITLLGFLANVAHEHHESVSFCLGTLGHGFFIFPRIKSYTSTTSVMCKCDEI